MTPDRDFLLGQIDAKVTALAEDMADVKKRVRSIEHQSLRYASWAAGAGAVLGVLVGFFKTKIAVALGLAP